MKYTHLVATDMDYTLLLPGQSVSEENRRAAKALEENGIALTLATGRTSFLTGKYIRDLDIKVPVITSNGAALFDYSRHLDTYSLDFTHETRDKLISIFLRDNVNATGYSSSGLYFLPESSRREFIRDYNESEPESDKIPMVEITSDWSYPETPEFNKFLVLYATDSLLSELATMPELEVVSSAKDFYDIMRVGSSKGKALLTLAEQLGIPRENTFALGDSDNDVSMIEDAAYGIAMSGSTEPVLAAASYVSTTCAEDGFAKAVFEYIIPKAKGLI